jgi:diguanylate cyclase (GGDEF)-like protein
LRDTLTEVANRHQFNEQLEKWSAALQDGHAFALHWIDLDHFKEVNDTLGHPAGDALLKSVANRIRKMLRGTDLVGRLGGMNLQSSKLGLQTSLRRQSWSSAFSVRSLNLIVCWDTKSPWALASASL